MTLETFFEKFALFADAPDAVAKMRELVLELAFTGRLSGKIPNIWEARGVTSLHSTFCLRISNLRLEGA